LEGDPEILIPTLSAIYSLGSSLSSFISQPAAGGTVLSLVVNQSITKAHTYNVLCTTRAGLNTSTVIIGAHLDSVPEGPGINDNGSGSVTVLETALQYSLSGKIPVNQIIFAWWTAEEIGLVGSSSYVQRILKAQNESDNIAVVVNFDMLGSPNFVPIVTDGNNTGSKLLTNLFFSYLNTKANAPPTLQSMQFGRTDFVAFDLVGIPIGNLFTGAETIKDRNQQKLFGGLANVSMDPCYHLSCDDLDNINQVGLGYMSSAAAYMVELLSQQVDLRTFISRNQTNFPTTYMEAQ